MQYGRGHIEGGGLDDRRGSRWPRRPGARPSQCRARPGQPHCHVTAPPTGAAGSRLAEKVQLASVFSSVFPLRLPRKPSAMAACRIAEHRAAALPRAGRRAQRERGPPGLDRLRCRAGDTRDLKRLAEVAINPTKPPSSQFRSPDRPLCLCRSRHQSGTTQQLATKAGLWIVWRSTTPPTDKVERTAALLTLRRPPPALPSCPTPPMYQTC